MGSYPPYLDRVDLDEFTAVVPRKRSPYTLDDPNSGPKCGALPADAFAWRYPDGCLRRLGHLGNHAVSRAIATRLDRRESVETRSLELASTAPVCESSACCRG